MPEPAQRVLIIGAGIAGLTVANALLRDHPAWDLDLVDANPRPVGVAVGLSASALRPLDALGLLDGVVRASAPSMELHMCDEAGQTLVRVRRETPEGQPFPDNVIIERPALAESLAAPLAHAGVAVRAGVRVADVRSVGNRVDVEFDGGRTASYDLVIAADGVGSVARGRVHDLRPVPLSQLGFRWVTGPVPEIDHGVMFLGPRASKLGLWPLGGGGTYAFLTLPRPGAGRADRAAALGELAEVLDGFSFPGAAYVQETVPWDDVHIAEFQALAVPAPWHAGRVVLIGDAAHVMPPHGSSGAAMAIEDAYVLADELRRRGIDDALAAYGARRAERVRAVVDFSTENCRAENATAERGGDRAPLMDPGASQRFWEFLRQLA